jgi:octaprenyl-diphosphate synthase
MQHSAMHQLGDVAACRPEGSHAAAALRQAVELADLSGPLAVVRSQVEALATDGPRPASAASRHLLGAGGKAVRPLLTLLCAQAVGGEAERALACATAAELIHDATLLHDDVIDDGVQRRGKKAARVIWGNTVSVLSGDLLFVAARPAAGQGPPGLLAELLDAVGAMVAGEVVQFRHRGRTDLDLETYEQIVQGKTAALFRWCGRAGARCGGGSESEVRALGRYGQHVGVAFQIRDDVLDLTGDPATLGKAVGADLTEGKLTLPVLLALQARPGLAGLLEELPGACCRAGAAAAAAVARALRDTGAMAAAEDRMRRELHEARRCLAGLPPSPSTVALAAVADVIGSRER